MSDLAVAENLGGEIALYDIDVEAAERNARIGGYINQNPNTKSIFEYKVYTKLEEALQGADFVVISILPGTFKEMRSDVHAPEKYGIYQSVGDTVGPGGVLRAMRTVPIYEGFAKAIKEICPNAWVINFTNPMSICTKTLYDVFPEIKAFGCCHEVFHAQQFLCCVLKEIKGIDATRKDIYTDACGVNHFTWITEAKYGNLDILNLLPEFMEKFYEEGYYEEGEDRFAFNYDTFAMANGEKEFPVVKSSEEAVELMKALMGFGTIVSNVNMPNKGQMSQLPLGSIVETNCVFSNDQVKPVVSNLLPEEVAELVQWNCANIDKTYEGIKTRDLGKIYEAFVNQPLCENLSAENAKELFKEMCLNTREYLDEFYELDTYFE